MRAVFAAILVLAGAFAATPRHAASGAQSCPPRPAITEHRIARAQWVSGALATEYYAIRESWFTGKPVAAPGLRGRHRVDWLYAVHGVAMNGEGLGLDGRYYHFAGPYGIGWVNSAGTPTSPCWNGIWTGGHPAWLSFGWRTRSGAVTYPLPGGWSNGRPTRFIPPPAGLKFGPGHARTLPFWHAVATDPRVIPYGSRVFLRAYCDTPAHGWFRALDTGGAIIGLHVDVYRPPPKTLELNKLRNQRMYVVPPGTTGAHVHC